MELDRNSFLYETLLARARTLQRKASPNLLPFTERVARVAFLYHPGRFADGALENIGLQAGRKIEDSVTSDGSSTHRRLNGISRTLHVASEVHSVGGHSRVLAAWVGRDVSSEHAIVLTRQPVKVPQFLQDTVEKRRIALTLLARDEPITVRAKEVRLLAEGFDRVILHSHPDDMVPVVAFATAGGCPVAMFNHAHFSFSFGPTVADLIINTFPYYQRISRQYRFARKSALLSGISAAVPPTDEGIDKRAARAAMGLSSAAPVVMTIAYESYFRPGNGYDFFRTVERLFSRRPDVQFLVVGVPESSRLVPNHLRSDKRLRLLGQIIDPTSCYRAADLCLESFPMPSLGALAQSVVCGEAFPVPVYGPGESILRMNMLDYEFRPSNEDQYLDYICDLLAAPRETREKAAVMRARMLRMNAGFPDQFPSLYQQIDSLRHAPGEIPETHCWDCEDTRALASLADPDLSQEFDSLLPFCPALLARLKMVQFGYETKADAARRICSSFRRVLGG